MSPSRRPSCIRNSPRRSKANPKAKAVLDGFPPSAQRDYLDWVAEAKQDKTRAKRIADAVEWLSRRASGGIGNMRIVSATS